MQTVITIAESLVKRSKSEPWRVSLVTPNKDQVVTATIGPNGNAAVGPRLSEVLSVIEGENRTLPLDIRWDINSNLTDNFDVTFLDNDPIYVDISVMSYKLFMRNNKFARAVTSHSHEIREFLPATPTHEVEPPVNMFRTMATEAQLPSDTDYFLIGELTQVRDGDTIDLKVLWAGNKIKEADRSGLVSVNGKPSGIRFLGIQTPETADHSQDYGDEKNNEYAERFKITQKQAYEIGDEATQYTKGQLSSKTLIVIDCDIDEKGALQNTYNRIVGVVYKTNAKSVDDIRNGKAGAVVHLNKSLLVEKSKIVENVPLAIPYDFFSTHAKFTRHNAAAWEQELGLKKPEDGNIGNVGEDIDKIQEDEKNKKKDANGQLRNDESSIDMGTIDIRWPDPDELDNRIAFFAPLDDRFEESKPDSKCHVRIGDVNLIVPPLAIQVNRQSNIQKVKTLRSRSSMMTKAGSSVTKLTLQLYFEGEGDINGHVRAIPENGYEYWMDGLRPLIAQFKRCPFLPIDNPYINDVLGIHDVALADLSVSTVPGFPRSVSAVLTLYKFDVASYMPEVSGLGTVINYPLMRWYYQDIMRKPNANWKSYLSPISSGNISCHTTFLLADENELEARQNAIQKLRTYQSNRQTPEALQEMIENSDTAVGQLIRDGIKAERVLEQHDRYYAGKGQGYDLEKTIIPASPDPTKPKSKTEEFWCYIYGNQVESSRKEEDHRVIHSDGIYHPVNSRFFGTTFVSSKIKEESKKNGRGCAQISFKNGANLRLFKGYDEVEFTGNVDKGATMCIVPMSQENVGNIKKVIENAKAAKTKVKDMIKDYNNLMAKAELTEGNIGMVEYEIPDLIVTGMNVMFENNFAQVQVRNTDSPLLQYLGAQDPYLQITAEGTDATVEKIREILEEADRYSREYRLGITAGFLGIKNELAGLFGVSTIMVENALVSTMPGFPGRYQIELTVTAFDKTQKRTEQLNGISPVGETSMDARYIENSPINKDHAVFEYKMRTLEPYPDLELPTYDELNKSLGKIGAGFTNYPNPGQSRFLDPDFYVSTMWTLREDMKKQRGKDQKYVMADMMGVQMHTSRSTEKPIDGSPEMWDLLKQVDEKSGEPVESLATWGLTTGSPNSKGAADEAPTVTVVGGAEVEAFIKDINGKNNPPTKEELDKWGVKYGDYEKWSKMPTVEPKDIYNYIYSKVDSMFKDYYFNDKGKTDDPIWKHVTYSKGWVEVFGANYKHLTGKDPKEIEKKNSDGNSWAFGGKAGFFEGIGNWAAGRDEAIKESAWAWCKHKIPRERLANLIKALFDMMSRWRQFTASGKPNMTGNGNNLYVGIGQHNLATEAKDVEMAKRLLWDWKYNIDLSFDKLHKGFKQAADDKDNAIKAQPWDWMIRLYKDPEMGKADGKDNKNLETQFFKSVYSKFDKAYNSASQRYATAYSPVDANLLDAQGKLSEDQKKLVKGDRNTYISELEKVGYDKKDLEKLKDEKKTTTEMVRNEYEKYMMNFFEYRGPSKDKGTLSADAIVNRQKNSKVFENFKMFMTTKENVKEAVEKNSATSSQEDPKDIFKDMLIDMIEYDHRGRLVRAFPTFQMFIIDEGRWMSSFRIWDNMYGFNAIQSIDVHKNRKIAADTAVIRMTNMYSNLSNRPLDTRYGDWDYNIIDNLFWGMPSQELLDARKELLTGMLLQPGARIHLRMGYGSSVPHLPVVFNGVITEMDTDSVVEIVAQGDGMELTNIVSADPEDSNDTWKGVKEPRDFLCELMTSKGNWFKDAINYTSDGKFFQENPLGIQHFGNPDGTKTPPGNVFWSDENYGEAAQNIYSSNGLNTFSQWTYKDGKDIPFGWDGFIPKWNGKGDEANIEIALYNRTVWDIANVLAYCSPDYIASVVPFELRSTLFFGKPYWRVATRYESRFQYDSGSKTWSRYLVSDVRKPFMQAHFYDGNLDIIRNDIKATADDVFTNVIVKFDGGQTDIIYADWDIFNSQQRTTVVEAPIVGGGWTDFWTTDQQALYYGYSTVRDHVKDMYKGELIVMGDPTVKPHDMIYVGDNISDMHGTFLCKAVTHQFSFETGFISSIQPDAFVVNDDVALISMANWMQSFGIGSATVIAARKLAGASARKMMGSARAQKAIAMGGEYAEKYGKAALSKLLNGLPEGDPDVKAYRAAFNEWTNASTPEAKAGAVSKLEKSLEKITSADKLKEWEKAGHFGTAGGKFKYKGLVSSAKGVTQLIKNGGKWGSKAVNGIRSIGTIAGLSNPIGWVALLGGTVLTESIAEMYRRKKARYQCVIMVPLTYQGRAFTAGINGHKGMVIGDAPGKLDNFLMGLGFDGKDGNWAEDPTEIIGDMLNFFFDPEGSKNYYVSNDDLAK